MNLLRLWQATEAYQAVKEYLAMTVKTSKKSRQQNPPTLSFPHYNSISFPNVRLTYDTVLRIKQVLTVPKNNLHQHLLPFFSTDNDTGFWSRASDEWQCAMWSGVWALASKSKLRCSWEFATTRLQPTHTPRSSCWNRRNMKRHETEEKGFAPTLKLKHGDI